MKTSTALLAALLLANLVLAVPLRRGRALLETPIEIATAPTLTSSLLPSSAARSSGSDSSSKDASLPDGATCGCARVSKGTAGLTCYDFVGPIAGSDNVMCSARPCSRSPGYKCVDEDSPVACVVKVEEIVQLLPLLGGNACMPKVVTKKNVFLKPVGGTGGDSSKPDSSKSD
mmetsp:Transcript_17491/g.46619  ORF Transcript_17491/g.46619 Transcript_17491/m.46619 type:complete len:173 (-) Transcript_17491:54-572(-)